MISCSNLELTLAHQFIAHTGTHLFLTGKAGTGKTTFLHNLKKESPKRMVILAPTGIAAINAGGMTIHSFFQLPFAPFIPDTSFHAMEKGKGNSRYKLGKEKINILRSIDLLVIDEISMVRADLLDAIDDVLRRYKNQLKPFGGVQLLMIGDLQQLAPVVKENEWALLKEYYDTPYFFSSRALKQTEYYAIELKTVYRQSDKEFLSLLNAIRENKAGKEELERLNQRYIPDFNPHKDEGYIRLVTHNAQAQRINEHELERLSGQSFTFRATITDKFPEYNYPTDLVLELKRGAQVMFIKNDSGGEHRYYNGMIGEVVNVTATSIEVRCLENGKIVNVSQEEWANARYVLDENTKEIREEVEGVFRQYPLKLAWAITIHKSQGLTFDKAIIDASNSFAHGQTYVALSRCRTIEGLVLSAPLSRHAIISDNTVDAFTKATRENMPTEERFQSLSKCYYLQLLSELFDFNPIEWQLRRYVRLVDEHLYKLYPRYLETLKTEEQRFQQEVVNVTRKFSEQYTRLIATSDDYQEDSHLQERIIAGANYFREKLSPLENILFEAPPIVDNKEIKKRQKDIRDELYRLLTMKIGLLNNVQDTGFQTCNYLKQKALLTIGNSKHKQETIIRRKKEEKEQLPTDISHPRLYQTLIRWRNEKAAKLHMPVYTVIQQKAIIGIVNLLPTNKHLLGKVPYLGQKGIEKYGDELLTMINEYQRTK